MEEKKSAQEGLKEIRERKVYDYSKVRDLTITLKGKKIKFRNLLKNMATQLSNYNKLPFIKNRQDLLLAFGEGGFVEMSNFFTNALKTGVSKKIDSGEL